VTARRDLRIDSLRGLALCVVAVAHLDFSATRWSWDTVGHASFAEAFVFLSGLVAGMVYGRLARRESERAVWAKALARTRVLYLTYLGLVLYIAAHTHAVRLLGSDFEPWHGRLLVNDPGLALGLAPFFIYQPGFSDILPMYCVFVALMPFALHQIQRGRAGLVLGGSLGLWVAAQLGVNKALLGPVVKTFGLPLPHFDLFAWQILFVFGLWVGARRADGRPVRLPEAPVLVWLLLPPLLCSFAIRHQIFFGESIAEAVEEITGRRRLDPLRLANFAAVAYLTARLAAIRPHWFEWRWLAFIGQHSLQVFAFSVAVDYAAQSAKRSDDLVQVLIAVAVLASLTLPAWLHARYRQLRRDRAAPRSQLTAADPQGTMS
jgi:hypothetical protein